MGKAYSLQRLGLVGQEQKQGWFKRDEEDDDDEEDAEIEEGSLKDRTYRFQIKKDDDTNS